MTKKMIGTYVGRTAREGGLSHVGVHDYNAFCDIEPKCVGHRELPDPEGAKPQQTSSYDPPPSHYATTSGIDPWAIWDAYDLDRYTANAVKYLLRAGRKDIAPRLDDLIKARNCVAKAIEMEEKRDG